MNEAISFFIQNSYRAYKILQDFGQVFCYFAIDVNGKVTLLDLVKNKTIVHVCGNLQCQNFI